LLEDAKLWLQRASQIYSEEKVMWFRITKNS
jgi:hypothetical protein